jgi:hypothetical protein
VWLLVHDVASAQPRQVAVVLFAFWILNLEESILCIFVVSCGSRSDSEVPIEIIIVDEVWPYASQINKHIVELLQDEKA